MSDLTFLSAVCMAEQIREKRLSPVELVEAHLTRIQELNSKLNAFVQVDAEGARQQALLAETAVRDGRELGVLHGVPLSIKSSIEVAGLGWEAGTKLRAGVRGERDAPLVAVCARPAPSFSASPMRRSCSWHGRRTIFSMGGRIIPGT